MLERFLGWQEPIIRVILRDSTGAGVTGVVRTDTDLKIAVIADNSDTATSYTGNTDVQDITTLGTYEAPTASNCRFKEVDSTNLPGMYELQFEKASFAASGAEILYGIISHGGGDFEETAFLVDLAAPPTGVILKGSAQSGTATTIVLASGAISNDDDYIGCLVMWQDAGDGAIYAGMVEDSTASTDTLTVQTSWNKSSTTPASGDLYWVIQTGVDLVNDIDANITSVAGTAVTGTADLKGSADLLVYSGGTSYT